ncbi:e3 ubiquitin-protein ligase pub24 [Quercus suber]|uniref:U-box domain-containing protein n=1 Tax=Quercus suber TaxID=58331 RepID=A0AAW0KK04_QUESU
MDDIEVPQHFICPISLQIMKDPVTTITGITFDRESIEQWLLTSKKTICPVTKQPLPKDPDLTPNHTLRRLIQGWCTQNASHYSNSSNTFGNLSFSSKLYIKQLVSLAAENEKNRKYMIKAGLPKEMLVFIVTCFKQGQIDGLEEALEACAWSRNLIRMIEANTVFELIELELSFPEKKTTELILGILCNLCFCPDGRA